VDYGVADGIGPYSDAGNEAGPRAALRPGVLGPGHNCIILGRMVRPKYCTFYHAWDTNMEARQMFLDRLIWMPDGPRCSGPTWTPQPIVTILVETEYCL